MPQTVAMQRGTGSITNNQFVTLFTQSGGLATRVILNQLTWYFGNGNLDYPQINLIHLSSTGASSVIGYWQFYTLTGARQGQMMPTPNSAPLERLTNGWSSVAGAYGSNSNQWMGATSGINTNVSDGTSRSYMPQNCWIGPSDSLRLVFTEGSGGFTMTYGYSFTTITES